MICDPSGETRGSATCSKSRYFSTVSRVSAFFSCAPSVVVVATAKRAKEKRRRGIWGSGKGHGDHTGNRIGCPTAQQRGSAESQTAPNAKQRQFQRAPIPKGANPKGRQSQTPPIPDTANPKGRNGHGRRKAPFSPSGIGALRDRRCMEFSGVWDWRRFGIERR